jgi:hypothetical protein
MRISHTNSIQGYVGKWLEGMNVKACVKGKPSSRLTVPQPVQSLSHHELNVCLMLELFDENLTRLEKSLNDKKTDWDYDSYFKAIAFLDAIYLFSRMLLDSAAGVVRHYYNCNNRGHELNKSFSKLYEKAVKGELPDNLNKVFSECEPWFSQFTIRRDKIVHYYETQLIGFVMNSEGKAQAMQISPTGKTEQIKDLRSYIGMVMGGYQRFVDGLLDYWDEMFIVWYGFRGGRITSILEGRRANILWWAYQYGEYRNDNMVVSES